MKTPEQWQLEWLESPATHPSQDWIKAIQDEAYREGRIAGLKEAADRLMYIRPTKAVALRLKAYIKGVEEQV